VYLDSGDDVLRVAVVDDGINGSAYNGDRLEVLGLLINVQHSRTEQTEALPATPEQHHEDQPQNHQQRDDQSVGDYHKPIRYSCCSL